MISQLKRSLGKQFHDATKHTLLSVMVDPNYVDYSTQPTVFKRYPHFYRRFPLKEGDRISDLIRLTSTITFSKKSKYDSYQLRVNPSAGALYPTEIYVQIRGIKGFIDGIYHLEVESNSITLIYELIDDGLESYILPNYQVKGFIFLVSCVYFRSSWKYKNRSLRYCFLDSGHHLGAIEAAAGCGDRDLEVVFNFDKLILNRDLGFANQEFVTAAVISGEIKERFIRNLRSPLPFVSPTDYFEANSFIETGYKQTVNNDNLFNKNIQNKRLKSSEITKINFQLAFNKTSSNKAPLFNLNYEQLRTIILNRRSARAFKRGTIQKSEWEQIFYCLHQPLKTGDPETITIYGIINSIEGIESGLYQENHLLKSGDYSKKAKYLCLNQALAGDSAVTLFLTATYSNYQTAMQAAGWIGHRLYLISNSLGISCSGIGAYYDDETQEFLETKDDILYALVIGR